MLPLLRLLKVLIIVSVYIDVNIGLIDHSFAGVLLLLLDGSTNFLPINA